MQPKISIRSYDQSSRGLDQVVDRLLRIQESVVIARNHTPPANGFLISNLSARELHELLCAAGTSLYVASTADEVEGFCLVTDIQEFLALGRGGSTGAFHFPAPVSFRQADYLFQIGVSTAKSRAGTGTALVREAQKRHTTGLITDILVDPIENSASLAFFAKQGFEKVGELRIGQYRDFGQLISAVLLWPGPSRIAAPLPR